jgi:hypothetical protein
MTKIDDDLDKLQRQIEENQRKTDALGKDIDGEDKAIHPPKPAPDHASDGGII